MGLSVWRYNLNQKIPSFKFDVNYCRIILYICCSYSCKSFILSYVSLPSCNVLLLYVYMPLILASRWSYVQNHPVSVWTKFWIKNFNLNHYQLLPGHQNLAKAVKIKNFLTNQTIIVQITFEVNWFNINLSRLGAIRRLQQSQRKPNKIHKSMRQIVKWVKDLSARLWSCSETITFQSYHGHQKAVIAPRCDAVKWFFKICPISKYTNLEVIESFVFQAMIGNPGLTDERTRIPTPPPDFFTMTVSKSLA